MIYPSRNSLKNWRQNFGDKILNRSRDGTYLKFFGGRCLNFNNETVLACASGNPESTNGKLCYATEDGEGNCFSFK